MELIDPNLPIVLNSLAIGCTSKGAVVRVSCANKHTNGFLDIPWLLLDVFVDGCWTRVLELWTQLQVLVHIKKKKKNIA